MIPKPARTFLTFAPENSLRDRLAAAAAEAQDLEIAVPREHLPGIAAEIYQRTVATESVCGLLEERLTEHSYPQLRRAEMQATQEVLEDYRADRWTPEVPDPRGDIQWDPDPRTFEGGLVYDGIAPDGTEVMLGLRFDDQVHVSYDVRTPRGWRSTDNAHDWGEVQRVFPRTSWHPLMDTGQRGPAPENRPDVPAFIREKVASACEMFDEPEMDETGA